MRPPWVRFRKFDLPNRGRIGCVRALHARVLIPPRRRATRSPRKPSYRIADLCLGGGRTHRAAALFTLSLLSRIDRKRGSLDSRWVPPSVPAGSRRNRASRRPLPRARAPCPSRQLARRREQVQVRRQANSGECLSGKVGKLRLPEVQLSSTLRCASDGFAECHLPNGINQPTIPS